MPSGVSHISVISVDNRLHGFSYGENHWFNGSSIIQYWNPGFQDWNPGFQDWNPGFQDFWGHGIYTFDISSGFLLNLEMSI